MKPFQDDAAAVTIGTLNIENGTQAIAIHGQIDITRDKKGLETARTLAKHVNAIVDALDAEPDLPDVLERNKATITTINNPFSTGGKT